MFLIKKIRFRSFLKNNLESAFQDNIEILKQRLSLLTVLEYKIFLLLREGFSKKECSKRLNMKRRDSRKNIKNIFLKLKVNSEAELIVKYRQ